MLLAGADQRADLLRHGRLGAALGHRIPRRPPQRLRADARLLRRRGHHAVRAAQRPLEIDESREAWFYCMYLLCLTGLLGIAVTGDAFNAFVFLEISSLSTYVMIATGRDRRALLAAFQYLIMGTIGATFYVIGIGFLYLLTGSLNFVDIAAAAGDARARTSSTPSSRRSPSSPSASASSWRCSRCMSGCPTPMPTRPPSPPPSWPRPRPRSRSIC